MEGGGWDTTDTDKGNSDTDSEEVRNNNDSQENARNNKETFYDQDWREQQKTFGDNTKIVHREGEYL